MRRMRADVADRTACARLGGIGAPARLFLPAAFDVRRQPALRIFDVNLAHRADAPGVDERTRFLDQRIAAVGVGDGENAAAALDRRLQLARLGQRKTQRLVDDDVEAVLQCEPRRFVMHMIGRDDGDEIHALVGRQRFLRGEHLRVARVRTRRIDVVGRTGLARALRIAAERAADQFGFAVQFRGDAMDAADERTGAAADQSHA